MLSKLICDNEVVAYVDLSTVRGVIVDPAFVDNPKVVLLLNTGHTLNICWAVYNDKILEMFNA